MKKLLMAVTVAVFPVGAAIGFCVVELVWQPNLSAKAKLLAVLVIGGIIASLWIGPLLIYSFMNNITTTQRTTKASSTMRKSAKNCTKSSRHAGD